MSAQGRDQRRHRVFFTRHTEYHLRADEVVGVRDRGSGLWIHDHAALRLRALEIPEQGEGHRAIGHRLQFWSSSADVLTSPIVGVGRPERDEVHGYCSQARAGDIHNDGRGEMLHARPN